MNGVKKTEANRRFVESHACKHCFDPIRPHARYSGIWVHMLSGSLHCYNTATNELHTAEPIRKADETE